MDGAFYWYFYLFLGANHGNTSKKNWRFTAWNHGTLEAQKCQINGGWLPTSLASMAFLGQVHVEVELQGAPLTKSLVAEAELWKVELPLILKMRILTFLGQELGCPGPYVTWVIEFIICRRLRLRLL